MYSYSTLLILCLLPLATAMRKQSVGVRGQFLCDGRPLANTMVKLWDEDHGPDPDDLLATGNTDANGRFQLSGSETELTTIDPRLKVYHNCDLGINPCRRKVTFEIPKKFIASGPNVVQWYDLGSINLNTKFPGEERDCIPNV
uniref:Transthyretin-like family protein n=1 Tax=Panagrellus redivivus TaxID=6233 RepID=A0A7E4URY2_PANRE